MKILITGGCGFIGTSLLQRLVKEVADPYIVILDNLIEGTVADIEEICPVEVIESELPTKRGVYFIKGDICEYDTVARSCQHVDKIVHLAANTGVGPSVENPRKDMENNVIGTFNVLEAARQNGVAKVVFASSGAPAGLVTPPIHEELPPHPVSPYGASKLAGEGYCSAYALTFGLATICLRFGNVYGPRSKRKSSVVAKFIRQALQGEACTIYGDGTQTRDFIYIDDLIEAIVLSLDFAGKCETFQIATGKELTVGEMAEAMSVLLREKGVTMEIVHDSPRLGDVMRNYSSIDKAKRMLRWEPKTSIESGLKKTIEYFLAR